MIKITDSIFINSNDVSAIEAIEMDTGPSPSGNGYYDFKGTVITLKNGRKIYVRAIEISPEAIFKLVKSGESAQ